MITRYDGKPVCAWVRTRLAWARRNGWTGQVISGHRSRAAQLRAAQEYSVRVGVPITLLYPRGVYSSRHLGRRWPDGAVDVTDPDGLELAMEKWTAGGGTRPLVGNGAVLRNDRPHFSSDGH